MAKQGLSGIGCQAYDLSRISTGNDTDAIKQANINRGPGAMCPRKKESSVKGKLDGAAICLER